MVIYITNFLKKIHKLLGLINGNLHDYFLKFKENKI